MSILTRSLAEALVEEQGLNVVIPDIYTSIDGWAFFNNQLASIEIPDSITSIGEWAFFGNQFTSIEIPNSITSIGEWVFSNNQLTSVEIPDSITAISDSAFINNQLASIYIPDTVTSIGSSAFNSNQLTSVDISNSVTSIGNQAFYANQLKSVQIGDSVTSIGNAAFSTNQLTSVDIPNSVISIGNAAFFRNNLTSVEIPDSVLTIGAVALDGNPLLENISISEDARFDLSTFPEDVEITKRSTNDTQNKFQGSVNKFQGSVSREWNQLLGTSAQDIGYSISTSGDGSIYVTGSTQGDLDGQINNGSYDAFISKFNRDGSKEWTRLLGSDKNDYGYSISTSQDGSIYIAGTTHGYLDLQTYKGTGEQGDGFISKFNSDGYRQWTQHIGSQYRDWGRSISAANDGSIYITGTAEGYVDGQGYD